LFAAKAVRLPRGDALHWRPWPRLRRRAIAIRALTEPASPGAEAFVGGGAPGDGGGR